MRPAQKETDLMTGIPQREIRPLDVNALKVAEFQRMTHYVILPFGTDLADVDAPEFWQRCASKKGMLKQHDIIELTDEQHSFWARYLVLEVFADHGARLHRLEYHAFPVDRSADDLPYGHDVVYLGPNKKWTVRRGGEALKTSFGTKESAVSWCIEMTRG